jgi:phytoene synthase
VNVVSRRLHFTNATATNFYYSFVFLSAEKQQAIEAVYAFARRGDDAADDGLSAPGTEMKMARCRWEVEQCYAEEPSEEFESRPELRALAEAVRRFKIPRRPFEDLILGFEMDLGGKRYATFDELSLYCYRVASTIGLIAIEIFGYTNPRVRDYAVNLGTALQLVNILRDVTTDARRGRVYLPEQDLNRFHVRREELLEGRRPPGLIEVMHFEADRAKGYFQAARNALPHEDRRSMVAAEIMAAIYWRLLGRIERQPQLAESTVRLSRPLKLWIALSVYLGVEWFKAPLSRYNP